MFQPRHQCGGGTQKHSGPDGGALRLINKAGARQKHRGNYETATNEQRMVFLEERLKCGSI